MKICPNCAAESPDTSTFCMECGFDLTQAGLKASTKTWDCACGQSNPATAKFCSNCGAKNAALAAPSAGGGAGKTQFFGAMQESGKAKLVLIKGGGFEGMSYQLNSSEHLAGREGMALPFPDDPYCNPIHANFFYFGGKFFVEDKDSLNGVYVRIRRPSLLKAGQFVRIGEQLFRFEDSADLPPLAGLTPPADGTLLLGSPLADGPKPRLVHLLQGGRIGGVFMVDRSPLLIGREGCHLNFPGDTFISGRHAQVTQQTDGYYLEDIGSKNGTYRRVEGPQELIHGDYVFIGEQLLRVELVA